MKTTMGQRIRAAREMKNLTQQQVADHFGIKRVSVTQWEGDTTAPESDKLPGLAKLLGGSAEWYIDGTGQMPVSDRVLFSLRPSPKKEPSNAAIGERVQSAGRMIPVYGQAVGGTDGEFLMNGTVLYEVLAPPSISPMHGAYAVSISGDSMYPRYEDGEVAFVDPQRRVKKGDYVVAQVKMEEEGLLLAYVKKFIRHNAQELVLEQFNPQKELRFPHENVHSVHYIAMAGTA